MSVNVSFINVPNGNDNLTVIKTKLLRELKNLTKTTPDATILILLNDRSSLDGISSTLQLVGLSHLKLSNSTYLKYKENLNEILKGYMIVASRIKFIPILPRYDVTYILEAPDDKVQLTIDYIRKNQSKKFVSIATQDFLEKAFIKTDLKLKEDKVEQECTKKENKSNDLSEMIDQLDLKKSVRKRKSSTVLSYPHLGLFKLKVNMNMDDSDCSDQEYIDESVVWNSDFDELDV